MTRTRRAVALRRRERLLIVLGASLVATVVVGGLAMRAFPGWDVREARVDAYALTHGTLVPYRVALVLADVFEPQVVAGIGVVLALLVGVCARRVGLRARMLRAGATLALIGVPAVVTDSLKRIVQRPRPALAGFDVVPPESWSFPSGHTAGATALVLTLLWLLSVREHGRVPHLLAGTLGLVLVVAVAMSRVTIGVHYPTDTIAAVLATTGVFLVVRGVVRPFGALHAAATVGR